MKNRIIEQYKNGRWQKTWWTVPEGTYPYPIRIPRVSLNAAKKALARARRAYPDSLYRISEEKP